MIELTKPLQASCGMRHKTPAFIVSGPESSGNRLIAALLVRGGCQGKGSTDQRYWEEGNPSPDRGPLVAVAHDPKKAADKLKSCGFDVRLIVCVRDPFAQKLSMIRRGHAGDIEEAERKTAQQWWWIAEQMTLFARHPGRLLVIPYEALILHPFAVREKLLRWCGLDVSTATATFEWNDEIHSIIYDANAAYHAGQPNPHLHPGRSGELIWWPERGMGYYPCPNPVYDRAYFEKYLAYEHNALEPMLTDQRVALVNRYAGPDAPVLDVGIGSGCFIKRRASKTFGYDINPVAVEWLKERGIWKDPMLEPVENMTLWDTLEHLPDPARMISRVRSWVFLSIPIFLNAEHVLRSKHFRKNEHYWYFTESGLIQWFKANGFTLIEKNRQEENLGREDIGTYVFRRKLHAP